MNNPLDIQKIRQDFPMLAAHDAAGETGKRFAYLDSASSSLTPVQVLDAVDDYYRHYRSNVHRGIYAISERASAQHEAARRKVADLIRADEHEIVFTRGTTESLNMVAHGLSRQLGAGDEVVMTVMEHHANIVPWQQYAKEQGFALKFIPLTAEYELDMEAAAKLITPRTKVLAFPLVSNVLGTIAPAAKMTALARAVGAQVVIDAAQAVGHIPVDVRKLDCDFLAFSGHKMLGPTGTGVLFGKSEALAKLPPMQFGGDMIKEVRFENSTWNEVPWKFEAGTPNIGGVIGLGAAAEYIKALGVENIAAHERELLSYALPRLAEVPGVRIIGPAGLLTFDSRLPSRGGAISFAVEGIHPHDIATILDAEGVCVRGGHHCAMPLMQTLGLNGGTARASLGIYTTTRDIDLLIAGLHKARKIFRLDAPNVAV